jgi:hypothetical protein
VPSTLRLSAACFGTPRDAVTMAADCGAGVWQCQQNTVVVHMLSVKPTVAAEQCLLNNSVQRWHAGGRLQCRSVIANTVVVHRQRQGQHADASHSAC